MSSDVVSIPRQKIWFFFFLFFNPFILICLFVLLVCSCSESSCRSVGFLYPNPWCKGFLRRHFPRKCLCWNAFTPNGGWSRRSTHASSRTAGNPWANSPLEVSSASFSLILLLWLFFFAISPSFFRSICVCVWFTLVSLVLGKYMLLSCFFIATLSSDSYDEPRCTSTSNAKGGKSNQRRRGTEPTHFPTGKIISITFCVSFFVQSSKIAPVCPLFCRRVHRPWVKVDPNLFFVSFRIHSFSHTSLLERNRLFLFKF